MADSSETAARIEIKPEDFRRILTDQIRGEVTEAAWGRLRTRLTLGGTVTLGLLIGTVTWGVNYVSSTVAEQVRNQLLAARPAFDDQIRTAAGLAAREAVRADITAVEEVRKRVAEGLPRQIAEALRTPEITAIIQRETEERLQDGAFWRQATRPVMAAQARDSRLGAGVRLFAFTDLMRDHEGEALARAVLLESARRVPDRGLMGDDEEARFLRQALSAYTAAPATSGGPRRSFADHLDLLGRLGELVDTDAGAFENLAHGFDEPRAIAWLLAQSRRATGPARAASMGALVSHPSEDAQERVEYLLCGDMALRNEVLLVIAARRTGMQGDVAGQRFRNVVRCAEEEVLARRLPAIAEACLPDRELLVAWRASRQPARRTNASRRRAEMLHRALAATGETCGWAQRLPPGETLHEPGRWRVLRVEPPSDRRERPLLGFEALLPLPADGTEPAWLVQVATGEGEIGGMLRNAAGRLAYITLLQERLAGLPGDMPRVAEARLHLLTALIASAPAAGRPAERLALEMLSGHGNRALCTAALDAFAATPALIDTAPTALAEALACFRRDAREPEVVSRFAALVSLAPGVVRPQRLREVIVALTEAAGLGEDLPLGPDGVMAHLAHWLGGLDGSVLPDAEQVKLLAHMAQVDLPAVVGPFEQGDAAERFQRALAGLPAADRAPLLVAMPYLDAGFAAGVPVLPAAPREAGARLWSVLRLEAPGRLSLASLRGVVLLRSDPFQLVQLRRFRDRVETDTLEAGSYLIGTPAGIEPLVVPPPPELAPGPGAVPVREGTIYGARLGPPRLLELAAEAGRSYVIETFRLERRLDTVLAVLGADGRPAAEDDDSGDEPLASRLCFTAREAGPVRLRVASLDGTPDPPRHFELRIAGVQDCRSLR